MLGDWVARDVSHSWPMRIVFTLLITLIQQLPSFLTDVLGAAPFHVQKFVGELTIHFTVSVVLVTLLTTAFELRRQLSATSVQLRESVMFQKASMDTTTSILAAPRYAGVIGGLVEQSVNRQWKMVSRVTSQRYLSKLEEAARLCRSYETIQRRLPSWFLNTDNRTSSEGFFRSIRESVQGSYIRVFVIDDSERQRMIEELQSPEIMGFYWKHAGENAETYWLTVGDLREVVEMHRDAGLSDIVVLDEALVFMYDEEFKTLEFAVYRAGRHGAEDEYGHGDARYDTALRTFRTLRQMKERRALRMFQRVHRNEVRPPT